MSWALLDIDDHQVARGISSSIDMSEMASGVYVLQTEVVRIRVLKI